MAKRILITGDDGYKSIGTRLLIAELKPHFDLAIAGTKVQQSGVGGYINVTKKMGWGKSTVEGIPAIWVDGTPGDAMEFSRVYFKKPFDLVVSGINMGINVGASLMCSGTFAAAFVGVSIRVAPYAIALSWERGFHELYNNHSGREAIDHFHDYPGAIAGKLIRLALAEKCWGTSMLNINLPSKATKTARFTRLLTNTDGYWPPVIIRTRARQFWYGPGLPTRPPTDLALDADILASNMISITPCHPDMTNHAAWKTLKGKRLSL